MRNFAMSKQKTLTNLNPKTRKGTKIMKTTMQNLFFKQLDETTPTGWADVKSEWTAQQVLEQLEHHKNENGDILVKYEKLNEAHSRVGFGECLLEELPSHVIDNYGVLADFELSYCKKCGKVIDREYVDSFIMSNETANIYCCEDCLKQAEPDCEDFS